MRVRNHRLDGYWYEQTSNVSARVRTEPRLIVMHYTAGFAGAPARDWLLGSAGGTGNSGSSAHLVVDRDGTVWQICGFNRRAWHAGPSRYGRFSGINGHGIGIEIVNPGFLKQDGQGGFIHGRNTRLSEAELQNYGPYMLAPHSRVGSGTFAWPLYTEAQLDILTEIVDALTEAYPIEAVVSHEEIDTRGWKTDPGPAFPLDMFRHRIDKREEDAPRHFVVTATRLNIRGEPILDAERIDPPGSLLKGTQVVELNRDGDWVYVEVVIDAAASGVEGTTGWVSARYLGPVGS